MHKKYRTKLIRKNYFDYHLIFFVPTLVSSKDSLHLFASIQSINSRTKKIAAEIKRLQRINIMGNEESCDEGRNSEKKFFEKKWELTCQLVVCVFFFSLSFNSWMNLRFLQPQKEKTCSYERFFLIPFCHFF